MQKAFTLIELLVVIAVIAILAAIFFPVLSRAQKSAKQTQCISNLQQINTAMNLYLQDYDDRYPWVWRNKYSTRDQVGHPPLREALANYVQDTRLWQCPSDTGETFPNGALGYRERTPPFYTFAAMSSYDWPGRGWGSKAQLAGKPASAVKRPILAPMIFEGRPWHGEYKIDDYFTASPGRYNVLYCDGHIGHRTNHQWKWEDMPSSVQ